MDKRSLFRNGHIPVDRREGLSLRELKNEYDRPRLPVIVDDARTWPAMGKWTPAFFRDHYGHLALERNGRTITLAEQCALMLTSTEERPAPYPFNFDMDACFPELLAELRPVLSYGRPDRVTNPLMPRALMNGTIVHELFFGGRGSFYPLLHYDVLGMATQITQIHGEKEFFLFPPAETAAMYPRPESPWVSEIGNIFDVDLERFPLFGNLKPYHAVVREGETLFFPPGWWHSTWIPGPSITYGRTVLNAGNWDLFAREKYKNWQRSSPRLAKPAFVAGKALGTLLSVTELF